MPNAPSRKHTQRHKHTHTHTHTHTRARAHTGFLTGRGVLCLHIRHGQGRLTTWHWARRYSAFTSCCCVPGLGCSGASPPHREQPDIPVRYPFNVGCLPLNCSGKPGINGVSYRGVNGTRPARYVRYTRCVSYREGRAYPHSPPCKTRHTHTERVPHREPTPTCDAITVGSSQAGECRLRQRHAYPERACPVHTPPCEIRR